MQRRTVEAGEARSDEDAGRGDGQSSTKVSPPCNFSDCGPPSRGFVEVWRAMGPLQIVPRCAERGWIHGRGPSAVLESGHHKGPSTTTTPG